MSAFWNKKKNYNYEKSRLRHIRGFTSYEKSLIFDFLRRGIIAGKFTIHDVGQQIVGAIILSAPFLVTQEVWELAKALDIYRIFTLIALTFFVSFSILRYTRQQTTKDISKRMVSLIIVSYFFSFFVLYTVGIIGNVITDIEWAIKLVVMVSLFSAIGAATADILIFK